jgi:hypothetical protein
MKRRWLWPLIALVAAAVLLLWPREDPAKTPPIRSAGPAVPRPADQGTMGPGKTPPPPAMDR